MKQPLLQVKQTHRPHNLLTQYGEKFKGKELDLKLKPNYIELPAELCLNLGVPSSVIKSLYLIPSIMHRMTNLTLASQLRQEIQECSSCPFISATLIMQALTTLRCMESFSFERLELLGDSVLKYAVSCHLFLKYDKKHEGQLSAHRSLAVCNATLHALALKRNLPGYIRDEPFNPSRWVAPGTHSKKTVPCRCDGKMIEESVNGIVDMEHKVVKVGKTCDQGHRWMCSKTIADSVEALIGSYLVGGGLSAALEFMSWLNIPVAYESGLVDIAFKHASVHPNILSRINIHMLESQLGYVFNNKALLVEAITHASQPDSEGVFCYQRLEFLGDSVLDFLITRHLFKEHPDLTPGVLTDLRSAAVNNDSFAYVAVKYNLQQYIRHGSVMLLGQITKFVRAVQHCIGVKGCPFSSCGVKAPKVLGDIVESIAGAILVDSRFDVEHVWKIMKPLLSPIVTPETLHLHPIREVSELCHLEGYRIVWKKSAQEGELYLATLEVVLEDYTILGKGCNISKKSAREEAAQEILMQLKKRGIHHPRCNNVASDTEVRGTTKQSVKEISSLKDIVTTCNKQSDASESKESARKKSKVIMNPTVEEIGWTREQSTKEGVNQSKIPEACKRKSESSQSQEFSEKKARSSMASVKFETCQDSFHDKEEDKVCNDAINLYAKVCVTLCVKKGGPRNSLYDACKKLKWCGPEFHLLEGAMPHATRFSFKVVLHIPERGELSVDGEVRSDKKSAMDDAALRMLMELKKKGFCSIKR